MVQGPSPETGEAVLPGGERVATMLPASSRHTDIRVSNFPCLTWRKGIFRVEHVRCVPQSPSEWL